MNIIIAGAGKVGFNLAKILSIGHNVVVIDRNIEALNRIQESLDILTLCGNIEDATIYETLNFSEVELFIAVTNIDNVNLISAIIIDTVLIVKRKFVRLQQHFFDSKRIKIRMGIDKLIFPIKLASRTVTTLLKYPQANNVKMFKYTDYKLFSIRSSINISLDLTINMNNILIVGIERDKKFSIFQNTIDKIEILENDLLYLFGEDNEITHLSKTINNRDKSSLKKAVIFGGEALGIRIAQDLIKIGCEVKLVEKDLKLCEEADEYLQGKVTVLNSKYNSHEIFETENLNNAEIFISATNNDEFNIIKCLEAKDNGIEKVVAINNEIENYNLMHSVGIIAVRGPKMSAYHKIIEEISSTAIIIKKHFCGGKAVVFMRKIFLDSALIDKNIKILKLRFSTIFLLRYKKLDKLNSNITLQKNDIIIAFCSLDESYKVEKWIHEL